MAIAIDKPSKVLTAMTVAKKGAMTVSNSVVEQLRFQPCFAVVLELGHHVHSELWAVFPFPGQSDA